MKTHVIRLSAMTALLSLALLGGGCFHLDSHQGKRFIWVDKLEAEEDPWSFRLQAGDTVRVEVWEQEDLSGDLRVRSDGRVTLPIVGDVNIAGLTPDEAAGVVRSSLLRVVRDPTVVVAVVDVTSMRVGVIGEVESPGVHELDRGSGVIHAIATAGGLNEFADHRRVFVVRKSDELGSEDHLPIRFDYRHLVQNRGPAARFVLRPGDLVIVE